MLVNPVTHIPAEYIQSTQCGGGSKPTLTMTATTVCGAFIVSVHLGNVLAGAQAPSQWSKSNSFPLASTRPKAVSVTDVPVAKLTVHCARRNPHEIPAGLEVTLPAPPLTVACSGWIAASV